MELKLDELGRLHIRRANNWVEVHCQYNVYNACSDRCSKFQEPYYNNEPGVNKGCIDLCNGDNLSFTELYDGRYSKN